MIRATTPTHTFTFPSAPEAYSKILIVYNQLGKDVLTLTKDDLTLDGNTASITLSQEMTRAFKAGFPVGVQVRVLDADDKAFANKPVYVYIADVYNDEVLTNGD